MKKLIINIICIFCIILCGTLIGCESNKTEEVELCAYIKYINDTTVSVEIVEYITRNDIKRIEELGIAEMDMPNGYYINTSDSETKEYILTDKTLYNFIDWTNMFVKEGSDRNYSTSNKDEFVRYIDTYENSSPGMPFFIKIKDDKIISIVEKMMP